MNRESKRVHMNHHLKKAIDLGRRHEPQAQKMARYHSRKAIELQRALDAERKGDSI